MHRSESRATEHILTVFLILLFAVLPLNVTGSVYAQNYPVPPADRGPPPAGGPAPPPGQYPGPGSNIVSGRAEFEQALTRAALSTSFTPERLVENEKTRFTATIVYARPLGPGPKIDVAYANDAELHALDPKQFDITPVTDMRQNLDDGQPDGRGGLALSWAWDVTPRAVGSLTLTLEIEPVVIVGSVVSPDLARRNKPITIDVVINPNHAALDAVVGRADKDFTLSVPDQFKAEEPTTISASFVLQGASPGVHLRLDLAAADGSVPLDIVPKAPGPNPPPDTVFGEWEVTPGKEGDVRLRVAAVISTQSGDRPLEQRVEKPITRVADATASFWGSFQGIITGITGFVGLIVAVAGLAKIFPRQWKWVRRKLRLPDGDPTPPSS